MAMQFDALFVHPDPSLAKTLAQALWPEVHCRVTDSAPNLAEAFQKLVDSPYNICFISETLTDGVENFFKDMKTLGRDKTCFFFQIVAPYDPKGDAPRLIHGAMAGNISTTPTPAERGLLVELLQIEFHRQEVARRVDDVKEAVAVLLREIDLLARERQRGRGRAYDYAVKTFVQMHLAFDEEIFGQYVDALSNQASLAHSFEVSSVEIPDAVLQKNLPSLSKGKYSGPSHRVWERLLKKFGQKNPPKAD